MRTTTSTGAVRIPASHALMLRSGCSGEVADQKRATSSGSVSTRNDHRGGARGCWSR
ncbi:Uncharacterised protein [Mycobacteroides abscessus]|nr:Uncharacterised protein [Mycobacteroides abscessus]